ncbi:hypothetical protein NE236_29695 [Actinoallomurus purpureus]|uniref:hypothetical protein n=1 Tax=Actinoallomurus purpureus TaxID=478114 RepID=UPI00209378A4|nr:hypothetical protein [Actinoallomurus purpureus]MCO6009151.1 hypothetical protein [Actinoallomurus purpureus]
MSKPQYMPETATVLVAWPQTISGIAVAFTLTVSFEGDAVPTLEELIELVAVRKSAAKAGDLQFTSLQYEGRELLYPGEVEVRDGEPALELAGWMTLDGFDLDLVLGLRFAEPNGADQEVLTMLLSTVKEATTERWAWGLWFGSCRYHGTLLTMG